MTESHAKWFANEAMKGRMTGHFEKFMTLKKALDEAWTKEKDERRKIVVDLLWTCIGFVWICIG